MQVVNCALLLKVHTDQAQAIYPIIRAASAMYMSRTLLASP
jgi:hypothetical protein